MKLYQKEVKEIKGSINVLDSEAIIEYASKGLLNLSMELGMEVLRQLMEEEVTEHAGEKGKHSTGRKAYRHGTDKTKVVMGGEKVSTTRPRIRTKDSDVEIPLTILDLFQNEDPLNEAVLSRLLSGVSCRKYNRTIDSGKEETSNKSKSEVNRRFIDGFKAKMDEFFSRNITGSYPVIMIDGLMIGGMTVIAALGIDFYGNKRVLGLVEGATENNAVVKLLLDDLIKRGLNTLEARLYVLDGAKALHKAVADTFGDNAIIQRCQIHKKRNVLDQLPKSEQANISISISNAYKEFDYDKAKASLELIIKNLEYRYPKAAESLREGLEETLSVHKLKVPGLLRQTISSTNAMESANAACMGVIRKVTNFKNGETIIRHAAVGFMEAEKGFRRIKGYRQIPLLNNQLLEHVSSGSTDKSSSAAVVFNEVG